MIGALQALARAVALEPRLTVVAGAPGSGWSLEPVSGVISCDPDDLVAEAADECRALAVHEAAHAAVTRYPWLVPPDLLAAPGVAVLLNALEDCRIETWLMARWPGARAWLTRANDRLFPADGQGLAAHPWSHQFALGAIHAWWHGVVPESVAAPVRDALDATAEARKEVVAAQPPLRRDVPPLPGTDARLRACFAAVDRRRPPDAFEQHVRRAALAAWQRIHRDILPAHRALVQHDRRTAPDFGRRDAQMVRQLRGPGTAHGVPAPRTPAASGEGHGAGGGRGTVPAARREALEAVLTAPAAGAWEAAQRAVAPLSRPLTEALEQAFRAQTAARSSGGHASGRRPDLRALMQAQADPRRGLRVWERRTLPQRRDPWVHLLVDLSASMEGEPVRRALEATVLLCEVMATLRLPFAVTGFQDVPIPFKAFDEPLDAATRARIGGMVDEVGGRRPGGRNRPEHNHDGPVIEAVVEAFVARSAGDRVLLVLSDGHPSGPGDGATALRQVLARVEADGRVHVVGLGIGPGTAHVARYYADHLAAVPLAEVPAALGRLLRRRLRGVP